MAIDKAQKQLIDSYFRKRVIADPQGYDYRFKSFEKIYMLKTGVVEFDKIRKSLNGDDISAIITDMPELRANLTKDEYRKMDDNDKANVFIKRPELADDEGFQNLLFHMNGEKPIIFVSLVMSILQKQPKFTRTNYFKKFVVLAEKSQSIYPDAISDLLIKQPALANEENFLPLLNQLTPEYVVATLSKRPELADKFNLKKLGTKDAMEMFVAQPELADRLNLSKMNKNDIEDLVMIKPELAPLLKRIKRNG
jgi:hypothetical protein